MNTALVKSVPEGEFEEVSIEHPNWREAFEALITQRKPIRYQVYTMPNLSREIQDALNKQSYVHLILESDQWQHFLVPREVAG